MREYSGSTFTVRCRGESMFPWIPDGTVVTFDRRLAPKIGDIVWAEFPHRSVVHRVLKVGPTHLTIQGDWNLVPDSPVARDCIQGVAYSMRRKGVDIPLQTPVFRLHARLMAAVLPKLQQSAARFRRFLWNR